MEERSSYNLMVSIVKKDIVPRENEYEKINSFFLCRWLSNHPYGVMVSNYINTHPDIPMKGQYWLARGAMHGIKYIAQQKKDNTKNEEIQILSKHYKCNIELANRYYKLLPKNELQKILDMYKEGKIK